jgi:hypothetical protein
MKSQMGGGSGGSSSGGGALGGVLNMASQFMSK